MLKIYSSYENLSIFDNLLKVLKIKKPTKPFNLYKYYKSKNVL